MERLRLLQEPLQHAPFESDGLQLRERALLVQLGVMRELGSLDDHEDHAVLQPHEDASDLVEVQRVPGEREIELRMGHIAE